VVEAQCVAGLGRRVQEPACQHRTEGVGPVLEGVDDAEVPASAPEPPEEVVVLLLAGTQEPPVRGDYVCREEVVAGETMLAVESAETAHKGEPAMPVIETTPNGVASPNACVSRSKSPRVRPGWALAVRRAGSTLTPFMGERSSISPPSHTALPATLWPPAYPNGLADLPCSLILPFNLQDFHFGDHLTLREDHPLVIAYTNHQPADSYGAERHRDLADLYLVEDAVLQRPLRPV
jgi:hypothetical protein